MRLSPIIVAIKSSEVRFEKMDGKIWLVLKILDRRVYQGKFPRTNELWVEDPDKNGSPGFTHKFPECWTLFCLRAGWWGRFSYALDPLAQGMISFPASIDAGKFPGLVDLLIRFVHEPEITADQPDALAWLGGLPSPEARQCLVELSHSPNPWMARQALETRLRANDEQARQEARELLDSGKADKGTRIMLEALIGKTPPTPTSRPDL